MKQLPHLGIDLGTKALRWLHGTPQAAQLDLGLAPGRHRVVGLEECHLHLFQLAATIVAGHTACRSSEGGACEVGYGCRLNGQFG